MKWVAILVVLSVFLVVCFAEEERKLDTVNSEKVNEAIDDIRSKIDIEKIKKTQERANERMKRMEVEPEDEEQRKIFEAFKKDRETQANLVKEWQQQGLSHEEIKEKLKALKKDPIIEKEFEKIKPRRNRRNKDEL